MTSADVSCWLMPAHRAGLLGQQVTERLDRQVRIRRLLRAELEVGTEFRPGGLGQVGGLVDVGGLSAARAWWVLGWLGVQDVRILDGGLAAWRAAGLPVVQGDEPVVPGDVQLSPGRLPTMSMTEVEAFVAGGGLLLDARAAERYRGSDTPYDPRPGRIPGAVSAPAVDGLDTDGRFRPVPELAERFAGLGAVPGRRVGVYCGSGVTASHVVAALALVGVEDVVLYPGSYSQWAADPDRPVATG